MRGLKNNGRLLCSPGTSFAPLGLDGANRQTDTQTDGHGDSMTNLAQWGRVAENNEKVLLRFCATKDFVQTVLFDMVNNKGHVIAFPALDVKSSLYICQL